MNGACRVRPSREFAPAGDRLWLRRNLRFSGRPESRQRVAPVPSPRGSRGTRFATLRSDNRAKSVDEVRCAHAPGSCASRLLQGGVKEQPNSPIAKPGSRSHRGISLPPSEPAEERKGLRPRAQHASSTDSAQLSERRVAERVLRGASRPEYRRGPEAQRRAGGSGAVSLVTFLGAQESDSPAGAKSRLGLGAHPTMEQHP